MMGLQTKGMTPSIRNVGVGIATSLLLVGMSVVPASAQTLIDRYSFNDSGTTVVDSVGGRNGTLANGAAEAAGVVTLPVGSGANAPQVTLPQNYASNLLNATFEITTTNFNSGTGNYACLLGFGTAAGSQGNGTFMLLQSNRANPPGSGPLYAGIKSATTGESGHTGNTYPVGAGTHQIDLVFSNYTSATSGGTISLFVDGTQQQSSADVNSLSQLGNTALNALGSGGTYNDPNFAGSITEFRVYTGALTQAQIQSNFAAGPDVVAVGAAAPEPGSIAMLLGGVLPLAGGIAARRRKRA